MCTVTVLCPGGAVIALHEGACANVGVRYSLDRHGVRLPYSHRRSLRLCVFELYEYSRIENVSPSSNRRRCGVAHVGVSRQVALLWRRPGDSVTHRVYSKQKQRASVRTRRQLSDRRVEE